MKKLKKIEKLAEISVSAFVLGMLVEKIILNGISWMSTIGYFK